MRVVILIVILAVLISLNWNKVNNIYNILKSEAQVIQKNMAEDWPPRNGEVFPNVDFIDHEGKLVKISDFKGEVLLIDFTGMNCPACQGFSGANNPAIGPHPRYARRCKLQFNSKFSINR